MSSSSELKVALAQISPVWLNKEKTIQKIERAILDASTQGAELIVFGEGLLPGYPFWLGLTKATEFDSKMQKEIFAHYVRNSVSIEKGELNSICALAKEKGISVYLGIIERAVDRGCHSLYCSLVYIDKVGEIKSVHRKLQPTYDERLVWSPGDGNGLQVHSLKDFLLGGLNCWENWMPLPRTALYAQGENVHIAVWPGSKHNTEDITRFIARESRSYVISVSSLMLRGDFPRDTPYFEEIVADAPVILADGGSCIAGPDGDWVMEPITNEEGIFTATIQVNRVLEERQNFDPVGHYSRPDVTKLTVNRERQRTVRFNN